MSPEAPASSLNADFDDVIARRRFEDALQIGAMAGGFAIGKACQAINGTDRCDTGAVTFVAHRVGR